MVDVGRDGFLKTMDVSCWSFMRMAHLAEPLMKNGGSMFTMTYYGSQMVVENYNVMGVAKAALEAAVRYIAAERIVTTVEAAFDLASAAVRTRRTERLGAIVLRSETRPTRPGPDVAALLETMIAALEASPVPKFEWGGLSRVFAARELQ